MNLHKLKGRLLLAAMMVLAVVTIQTAPEFATSSYAQASGHELYGAIGNHIVTVNQTTGDATDVGTTPDFSDIFELTSDPNTGLLFGIAGHREGDPKLIRIDPATGQAVLVGPIDPANQDFVSAEGLAFNPDDGLLYGSAGPTRSYSDRLVTINPATGEATVITQMSGTLDNGDADGMIFIDGTLYTVDGNQPSSFLYTIDQATGVASLVGDIGFRNVGDLAYNPETQTLFGLAHRDHLLITISLSTGQGTAVGSTHTPPEFGGAEILGLAIVSSLPSTTLACDDVELYPSQTVDVDLIASGTDVYGLQATCAADGSVAQVQSGSFGGFFPNIAAGANQVSGNSWYGAASQQNPAPPVSGSGTFATLMYGGVAAGTTSVTCDPLFSDRDGFEIDGAASACTITVLDYGHITGTLTYQGRLDHANIEVVATGPVTDMDLTDSTGNFDLDELHAGDYAVKADVALYLPACTASDVNVTSGGTVALPSTRLLGGDVNDNIYDTLVIDIGDATLVAANLDPSNPPADARADINADGVANVQDWSILQGNYEVSGCQAWQ